MEVAQDLDDGLQLAGDVVLKQPRGDDGGTGAGVTIEQSPVVKNQPFTVLQRNEKKKKNKLPFSQEKQDDQKPSIYSIMMSFWKAICPGHRKYNS